MSPLSTLFHRARSGAKARHLSGGASLFAVLSLVAPQVLAQGVPGTPPSAQPDPDEPNAPVAPARGETERAPAQAAPAPAAPAPQTPEPAAPEPAAPEAVPSGADGPPGPDQATQPGGQTLPGDEPAAPAETPPDDTATANTAADSAPVAPPEGEAVPVYVPPAPPAGAAPDDVVTQEEPTAAPDAGGDEILYSGYLPGYRRHVALGESPHGPRVGALPGGMTANFGAPVPPTEWVFSYGGSMTASLQASFDERPNPRSDQATTVFHVPPETVEVYNSFLATRSIPGNWASTRFEFGSARVKATVAIETWNPTQPTTYYQFGTQYFINNAFLTYSPDSVAGVSVSVDAGYFTTSQGDLSSYGNRMYTNPLVASLRGAGVRTTLGYRLSDQAKLYFRHELLLNRDGKVPDETIPNPENSYARPYWANPLINAITAGVDIETSPRLELRLNYINAFAADERLEQDRDDPTTRQQDEFDLQDPRMDIVGGTAQLYLDAFGLIGFGGSYTMADHAYGMRGLAPYASFGEEFTDRWLGVDSGGTGNVLVLALNYEVSLGQVVSYPQRFGGNGPDIFIKMGAHVAKSESDQELFNNRWRNKEAIDVLYTFWKHLGAGVRVDRVAPNSKDAEETFYVLAPRIQVKTDWNSRETFTLSYVKWFYGDRTRNEGTGERTPERLDDEFFGLSMNMWW